MDIYRAVEVLVFAQSVNRSVENFSFKCSKIVKKCLVSEKSVCTVTYECQKVNSGGYLLFIVQSEHA